MRTKNFDFSSLSDDAILAFKSMEKYFFYDNFKDDGSKIPDGTIDSKKGRTIIENDNKLIRNIFLFNKEMLWSFRLLNLTPRELHAALWWYAKLKYGNASGQPGFTDDVETINGIDYDGVNWGKIDYQNDVDYNFLLK